MNYTGLCKCERWSIAVSTSKSLSEFNPRVCDCSYCKTHPSALISDPDMIIHLSGDAEHLAVNKNGDQLANFYHCSACGDLLSVGCIIGDRLRGAVNSFLLDQRNHLGDPVAIQPRLLSAEDKLSRWSRLWGTLEGVN